MIVTTNRAEHEPPGTAVLVNHDLFARYRHRLEGRFPDLPLVYVDNYADLPQALEWFEPEILLTFKIHGGGTYPRALVLEWPSLRWLHAGSVGIDHLVGWDKSRLTVTNSSGIHTAAMSEYVLWAVLNQTLRMPYYASQQRDHRWAPLETRLAASFSAVVVGFGSLGMAIGRRLKSLGMRVTGVRTTAGEPSDAADAVLPAACLGAALAAADFVIVTLPLTPLTRRLFDANMLGRIKPGGYLINVGRGEVVDASALAAALRSGALSGAQLDVLATEPLPPDDPLWAAPNLSITPHVSADIEGWHALAAEVFSANLRRWLDGETLMNLCDPVRGY